MNKKPHGGQRPGAGAPEGNKNRLGHTGPNKPPEELKRMISFRLSPETIETIKKQAQAMGVTQTELIEGKFKS